MLVMYQRVLSRRLKKFRWYYAQILSWTDLNKEPDGIIVDAYIH